MNIYNLNLFLGSIIDRMCDYKNKLMYLEEERKKWVGCSVEAINPSTRLILLLTPIFFSFSYSKLRMMKVKEQKSLL